MTPRETAGQQFPRPQLQAGGSGKGGRSLAVGGRLLGPQAEAGAHEMQQCSAWGQLGEGASGESPLPGGRGEKLPVLLEGRLLPGAICIRSIKTRAVVTCQWPWGGRQGLPDARGVAPRDVGLACPRREKFHLPTLLPCHTPPASPAWRSLPAAPHTLGLRVRWLGAWGERC